MSDWRKIKLGDFAKFSQGIQIELDEQKIEPFENSVRFIRIVDFTKGTPGEIRFISNPGERYCVEEDDLVMIRYGSQTAGKIAKGFKGAIANNTFKIVPDDNINKLFLYYHLSQRSVYDYFSHSQSSSTMPAITFGMIGSYNLQLPPLPEQKAIAGLLSCLDDKINLLHQQNKTLEAMAETLFRRWFDNFENHNYRIYPLKEIVLHIKPGTNYQPNREEDGIPFLNVRNLSNGFIDRTNFKFISEEEYKRVHKVWQPEANDILISRIGTLGIVSLIRKQDLPLAVHYNMLNLKAKVTSYQFLYYLLKSKFFQTEYEAIKRASVQEYVAIEDVQAIEIPLPTPEVKFKEFEQPFISFLNKANTNYNQILTLEKLRDTILPKLMNGEVRVSL